jgi:lysophospholipase L1-like esterase
MKKLFRLIIFSSLGIFIALVLLVIFDRILGIYLNLNGYFKVRKPGLTEIVQTNEFSFIATSSAQGIRNEEVKNPKPKDIYRIFALGDSFTYGWGVNLADTWVKKLEDNLKIPGKKIEVVNLGMTDMDMGLEIQTCRVYKYQLQPDAIILGLFITEDLNQLANIDSTTPWWEKQAEKYFPTLKNLKHPFLDPILGDELKIENNIIRVSDFWKVQARKMVDDDARILSKIPHEIIHDFVDGKVSPTIINLVLGYSDFWTTILDEKNLSNMLRLFENEIKNLKKTCSQDKPVYIVGIPPYDLFDKDLFIYRQKLGFATDERLLTIDIDRNLSDICDKYGVKYIPLLTHFRQNGCKDCYFPWDNHLTPLGNSKTAEFIASYLKDLK